MLQEWRLHKFFPVSVEGWGLKTSKCCKNNTLLTLADGSFMSFLLQPANQGMFHCQEGINQVN